MMSYDITGRYALFIRHIHYHRRAAAQIRRGVCGKRVEICRSTRCGDVAGAAQMAQRREKRHYA